MEEKEFGSDHPKQQEQRDNRKVWLRFGIGFLAGILPGLVASVLSQTKVESIMLNGYILSLLATVVIAIGSGVILAWKPLRIVSAGIWVGIIMGLILGVATCGGLL